MKAILRLIGYVLIASFILNTQTTLVGQTIGNAPIKMGGIVDVSPAGAATYQLPIQVSPGSNGLQPALSIVYNSQAGNGLLGYGWNLAGLSSITKEHFSPYYDNPSEILSLNDVGSRIALDGVRLVKLDQNGYIYHPANNPYVRVVYSNDSFTVTTQDGTVMEYGATPDSKIKGVNATQPYSWAVSRITDVNGNYIDFIYENNAASGESRIGEIKYTGNSISGKTPYNSVKFFYENRNDTRSFYVFGNRVGQNSLLTNIKVYCEGVVSKDYTFTYENNFYTRLKTINLYADGVMYAPTAINWNQSFELIGYVSNADMGTLQSGQSYFGDFNGDGRLDRAVFGNDGDLKIYFSNSSVPTTIDLPDDTYTNLGNGYTLKVHNVKSVDIFDGDNDGMDDIFIHSVYSHSYVNNLDNSANTYYETNYISSYVFNPSTSTFSFTQIGSLSNFMPNINLVNPEPTLTLPDSYDYYFADLDMNGTVDKVAIKNKKLDSFTGITVENIPTITGIVDVKFIDFNGNGRTDILFMKSNGYGSIWEFNGEFLFNVYGDISSTQLSSSNKYFFPGDFNGDGKTDYIGRNADGWFMKHSTGVTFVNGVLPEDINTIEVHTPSGILDYGQTIGQTQELYDIQKKFIPALAINADDINNDGLSDIIFARYNQLYIYLNKGNSFQSAANLTMSSANYPSESKAPIVIYCLDFDSDGQKEIIYGNTNYYLSGNYKVYEPFKKVTFSNRMDNGFSVNSITDGLEGVSTFTYSNFTDFVPFNSVRTKPAYPLMLVRGPIKVISNLKTEISGKLIGNISYTYSDAHTHLHGLGYLGFKKVTSSDAVSGVSRETLYTLEVPNESGIYSPWPSKTVLSKNSVLLSTTESTMSALGGNTAKKCFLMVETQSTVTDHISGVVTNSNTTYNALLGRVSLRSTSAGEWSTSTTYNFEAVGSTASRLLGVTATRSNAHDSFNHSISYTYGSSFPFRVLSKTEQGVTSSYTSFDDYGNISAINIGDRTSTFTYDAMGRFMVLATDHTGLTTQKSYRNSDGATLSETNPHGLSTQTTYEANAGRLASSKSLPSNVVINSTVAFDNTGDWNLYKQESVVNGSTVMAYYNFAGQKVKETATGFKGVEHSTLYGYNPKGLLVTEQSTGVPTATTYSYDNLDRLVSVTGHNGLSITYEYGSNYVKTTSSVTGTEIRYFDAVGNTTRVEAPTGTVEYKYFASGKVKEIVAEGNKTEMTYERGNQLTLKDPSSGTTTYSYSMFNELVSQTDAKGQTTTITYEGGRVKSRTSPGITETYSYYTEPSKQGLLRSVSRNGVVEEYTYDQLGRLSSLLTTGMGRSFGTAYQYNGLGLVEYISHPTGLTLKYGYDSYGNLESISDSANLGVPIWQGKAKNGRNQWEQFALGNGLITNYTYSDATLMISNIRTGTAEQPAQVQDLQFAFNAKGQLVERMEGSLLEQFLYDDQNRLTQSAVNGQNPVSIAYAANGNITSTSAGGSYTYVAGKPFAVDNVVSNTQQGQAPGLTASSTFTADNRIEALTSGTHRSVFTYGPSGSRFGMEQYQGENLTQSTIYVGSSEFTLSSAGSITRSLTFVQAPTGICAVYEKNGSSAGTFHYVHTDYLGSWLTITDSVGQEENRYSYDAWGRPRNPSTWEVIPASSATQPRWNRGYTGHEHLCGFGLINMNGRLYDPYLQRFLSPDPYVQSANNAQNYNRYSYVLNNPLMYTDPTGYKFNLPRNDAEVSYGWLAGDLSIYSNQKGAFSAWGGGGGGYYYSWSNRTYYSTATGQAVAFWEVYNNYIAPNSFTLYRNSSDCNLISLQQDENGFGIAVETNKGGFYMAISNDLNNITLIADVGVLGIWNPSGQGSWHGNVDWAGFTNATLSVLGGVGELAVGGVGEYFSVGTASTLCVPLIADGAYRIATNFTRMVAYLTLCNNFANAMPGNIGATLGKGVDMACGKSFYDYGFGQAFGGVTNDFASFIFTGGTAASMNNMVRNPSLMNGVWYTSAFGGYSNSLFMDLYSLKK